MWRWNLKMEMNASSKGECRKEWISFGLIITPPPPGLYVPVTSQYCLSTDLYQCTTEPMHNCTNAQLYQCTIVPMHSCTNAQLYQCTTIPMHNCTNAQLHQCITVPMHNCTNAQLHQCTTVPMYNCTNAQLYQCTNLSLYTHVMLQDHLLAVTSHSASYSVYLKWSH